MILVSLPIHAARTEDVLTKQFILLVLYCRWSTCPAVLMWNLSWIEHRTSTELDPWPNLQVECCRCHFYQACYLVDLDENHPTIVLSSSLLKSLSPLLIYYNTAKYDISPWMFPEVVSIHSKATTEFLLKLWLNNLKLPLNFLSPIFFWGGRTWSLRTLFCGFCWTFMCQNKNCWFVFLG